MYGALIIDDHDGHDDSDDFDEKNSHPRRNSDEVVLAESLLLRVVSCVLA